MITIFTIILIFLSSPIEADIEIDFDSKASIEDLDFRKRDLNFDFNQPSYPKLLTNTVHNIIEFNGNGSSLLLNQENQSQILPNHQIIISNAPNSRITDLEFFNSSLFLVESNTSTISYNSFVNSIFNEANLSLIHVDKSMESHIIGNRLSNIVSNASLNLISIVNSSSSVIEQNQIENISIDSTDFSYKRISGIVIQDSNNALVENNTISSLYANGVYGIIADQTNEVEFHLNKISNFTTPNYNNSEATGIGVSESFSSFISQNYIYNLTSIADGLRTLTFGITVIDSVDSNIFDNYIDTMDSQSFRPDTFGIHIARSNNTEAYFNYIKSIYSFSEIPQTSYATGIYNRDCFNVTIGSNYFENIIAFGRASYGIYGDLSVNQTIVGNHLVNLTSYFYAETYSVAILLRQSIDLQVSDNTIEKLISYFYGNLEQISSSIGILIDSSDNLEIKNNTITDLIGISEEYSSDAIGIIVGNMENILIADNVLSNYTVFSLQPGIVIGLSTTNIKNVIIKNLQITDLFTTGFTIGVYNSLSNNIYLENITFVTTGEGSYLYGIYILRGYEIEITKLNINFFGTYSSVSTFRFISMRNFSVTKSILTQGGNNDGVGFYLYDNTNGMISDNKINSFNRWMEISNNSKSINCYYNQFEDTILFDCNNPNFEVPETGTHQLEYKNNDPNNTLVFNYPIYLNLPLIVVVIIPVLIFKYRDYKLNIKEL